MPAPSRKSMSDDAASGARSATRSATTFAVDGTASAASAAAARPSCSTTRPGDSGDSSCSSRPLRRKHANRESTYAALGARDDESALGVGKATSLVDGVTEPRNGNHVASGASSTYKILRTNPRRDNCSTK